MLEQILQLGKELNFYTQKKEQKRTQLEQAGWRIWKNSEAIKLLPKLWLLPLLLN